MKEQDDTANGSSNPIDYQLHLKRTWHCLRQDPVVVLGGGLTVQLAVSLSFGLLAGPLAGGYIQAMITAIRENRRPTFNELFAGLSRMGPLFPYVLVCLLTLIGFFFFIVPGLLLSTLWLYCLPLMTDRRLGLLQAMYTSRQRVSRVGFGQHLVLVFLITVVPAALINVFALILPIFGLLHVFVLPLQSVCLASLYLEQFGDNGERSASDASVRPILPSGA